MPTTIYADTLFFINMILTYFLLRSTQVICRRPLNRVRLLVSSFCGGLYALSILVGMHVFIAHALRVGACLLLCAIAFGRMQIRAFVKCVGVFLLMNGLFAGIMLAVRMAAPQHLYSAGVVYLDVNIPFLLLSALGIYVVLRLMILLFTKKMSQSRTAAFTIRIADQTVSGTGMFDTGHHLTDSFTGKPVLIVRPGLIEPILPAETVDFFCGKEYSQQTMPEEWRLRLRLFPYSSLGGEGLLPAFRSDSITICDTRTRITREGMYVAVSPRGLYHGECDALIPAPLYDEIMEGEDKHALHHPKAEKSRRPVPSALSDSTCTLYQRSANTTAAFEKAGRKRDSRTSGERGRNGARSADRT